MNAINTGKNGKSSGDWLICIYEASAVAGKEQLRGGWVCWVCWNNFERGAEEIADVAQKLYTVERLHVRSTRRNMTSHVNEHKRRTFVV